MMPGPLPDPHSINRNKKLPTTDLPVTGIPKEQRPDFPKHIKAHGKWAKAFWDWAWAQPQASAWLNSGMADAVARRALLEDLTPDDLKDRLALDRRISDANKSIGLTSESFAKLRWRVVAVEETAAPKDEIAAQREARRALAEPAEVADAP